MTAGARCKLIDKPQSIAMDMLVVKESVVVTPKDEASSSDSRDWVEQVRDYLNRCVYCVCI